MLMLLELQQKQNDESKLFRYHPYEKQHDFHDAGGFNGIRERLLVAGNQLGKTLSAGYEHAMHLTGEYPEWWAGKVWDRRVIGWASGVTSESTRDNPQKILLGLPGSWGTGSIPKKNIIEITRASHGVADAVDSVKIRHKSGGVSIVSFKAYSAGREKWQGPSLDFVWFDEEPPEDIYSEGLTRTNVGSNGAEGVSGITSITFTPLQGMSNVVKKFLIEKPLGAHVTTMTINDALHYTEEQRKSIIASYPAHERDARSNGTPTLGSGAIFPVDEDSIKEGIFSIPAHWPRIAGIDFGWDHPTAGGWLAWDRDTDTLHLYDVYRVSQASPIIHAATFKAKGASIPVSWPHDGNNDTAAGENLATQYRKLGLNMLRDKATHPPALQEPEGSGGNSVEAGLMEMLDRMQTGRFKVASHLEDFFEEFRLYHRKNGKVVKENDDIISAVRYAMMMLRFAKVPSHVNRTPQIRPQTHIDPMMGMLGY